PETTGQIYWGAVPFLVIQVLMISITIMFPQMVLHSRGTVTDPSKIEFKVPELPGFGLPPLGGPASPQGGGPAATDLSQPPSLGGQPEPQPAAPAAPDLSQPPSFNESPAEGRPAVPGLPAKAALAPAQQDNQDSHPRPMSLSETHLLGMAVPCSC